MTNYVVGFAMDKRARIVLLVKKNRPDWQAGKLNGIGGKIEPGEFTKDAMVREFYEETGLQTTNADWRLFAVLKSGPHQIHFFKGFFDHLIDIEKYAAFCKRDLVNDVGEELQFHSINVLLNTPVKMIPNISWLLPLARYQHDEYEVLNIQEVSRGNVH
jgi:8-oxo-dGTP diphosphatase